MTFFRWIQRCLMEEAASLNVGNKLNLSFLRETGSLTGPDPVTQEGESRSRPSGKQTEVPDGTSPLLSKPDPPSQP
jgi:hypothetical protein